MAGNKRQTGKITGAQKAAAVIIALGSDTASKIYKYLREDEVEQITYEVARMSHLSSDEVNGVLHDFYQLCLTQKVLTDGGIGYARNVLEKAYGPEQASSLLDHVTKTLKNRAFEFLRKADYKNLLTAIQNEHPQTIALVLSYVRPDQAAAVLEELPPEKRVDVVQRIANMDRISPDVIQIVENNLADKFQDVLGVEFTQFGGVDYVADVMNNMDSTNEKAVFDELNRKNSKLSEEIRKKMFVFEDITSMDDLSIQRFLRDVDSKDLVLALKGAKPEVADVIFQNMSERAADTVRQDLSDAHNVRLRDVEEAQQRIVGVIRKLESKGEVVIAKNGDEIIE